LTSPIPPAALGAAAPTSRATFRLIAKCVDATNREADTLRHALLSQWAKREGVQALVDQLRSLDHSDPDGLLGADARLTIWFTFADPGDGRLVAGDDPLLAELSDDLKNRLAGISRPEPD
jgi:hypothetical protein